MALFAAYPETKARASLKYESLTSTEWKPEPAGAG
jgi:hypothetical protein